MVALIAYTRKNLFKRINISHISSQKKVKLTKITYCKNLEIIFNLNFGITFLTSEEISNTLKITLYLVQII